MHGPTARAACWVGAGIGPWFCSPADTNTSCWPWLCRTTLSTAMAGGGSAGPRGQARDDRRLKGHLDEGGEGPVIHRT